MRFKNGFLTRMGGFALAASAAISLAGCDETMVGGGSSMRAYYPIPPETLALMRDKGTTQNAPVLIRTYKKEAELEIWKMKADGRYAYLKTFPMCRWSGQLGPKVREGDRQVPEGFYSITPGQMNPNSNYYLSFNVGYPNAYDRAMGHTGGSIMVHGVCSSAGCFSMTDKQIAEIYAMAREAFNGGQRAIQMQSYPFHMTAENMAKYRADPNIAFWKQLKAGSDNFEVSQAEVNVGVCDKHYVFNQTPAGAARLDPNEACPSLKHDDALQAQVEAKETGDEGRVAELISQGVKPIHTVYADGGQNASFAGADLPEVSRPDALAQGPVDIALDEGSKGGKKKPVSPAVQIAAAKAEAAKQAQVAAAKPDAGKSDMAKLETQPETTKPETVAAYAAEPAPQKSESSVLNKMMWWKSAEPQPAVAASAVPAQQPAPTPATVPSPPKRQVADRDKKDPLTTGSIQKPGSGSATSSSSTVANADQH